MNHDEVFGTRGKDLEEAFFAKENQRLLEKLRQQAAQREKRDTLAKATGIKSDEVLDLLVQLDVNVERAAAFTLIPVVQVAWADGTVQAEERKAILDAAVGQGLSSGSLAYELIQSWLERPPDPRFLRIWKEYSAALCAKMTPEQRKTLKTDLLDRARTVAGANGGLLGIGAVSKAEKAVLAEMEKAFA
jgi:hypothetical protein